MRTQNDSPQFVIVMPAYNEAACIAKVVNAWAEVANRHFGLLLVVNDGSRDSTGDVLNQLVRETSALRVVHQDNAGHGNAVRNGYEHALKLNPQYVFQTDSDDQFNPNDFEKLWEARHESPFILGYREVRHDPLVRIVISRLNAVLLLVLFGAEIRDANVPFRLIEAKFLGALLALVPRGVFIPNIFLAVLAAKSRAVLLEIPVEHRERKTGVVTLNRRLIEVCKRCFGEIRKFRALKPQWEQRLKTLPIPSSRQDSDIPNSEAQAK